MSMSMPCGPCLQVLGTASASASPSGYGSCDSTTTGLALSAPMNESDRTRARPHTQLTFSFGFSFGWSGMHGQKWKPQTFEQISLNFIDSRGKTPAQLQGRCIGHRWPHYHSSQTVHSCSVWDTFQIQIIIAKGICLYFIKMVATSYVRL